MLIFIYNMILLVFFVPVLGLVMLKEYRKGGGNLLAHMDERLGGRGASPGGRGKPVLWMHCASLGEVRAAEPLLRMMTDYRRVLTVVSSTGRAYAEKHRVAESVSYAPLDLYPCVDRFVRSLKPRVLVVIETELWPGMLSSAKKHGARTVVVNGRLSAGSFPWYRASRFFWKKVLESVDFIAARSAEDADRFLNLGLPSSRVSVTGNIKYDRDFLAQPLTRADFGFGPDDRILVAGSIRDGEEAPVIDAWTACRGQYPGLRLVIVPRHAGRIPVVVGLLSRQSISFTLRSQHAGRPGDCLVVDTFGELQKLYGIADISFVGGSLVDRGGQNPIEPAAAGIPVIVGPHMENFLAESRLIAENGGSMTVRDAGELAQAVIRLLVDDNLRADIGRRARAAVDGQRGAIERSRAAVEKAARV